MEQTKKIAFVRVLRDCETNERLKAVGKPQIYDFDVLADGVKVATFEKIGYKRGYELVDLDKQQIKAPWFGANGVRRVDDPEWHWRKIAVDTKAEFEAEILREFDYIPTAEQIEQRRAADKAEADLIEAKKQERIRIARIEKAGPMLLAVLNEAVKVCEEEIACGGRVCVDIDSMKAVIAKATGQ